MNELAAREQEILARIAETRNGPILFTIHPLRLLSDIGVQLADGVVAQLKAADPRLAYPDERGYRRYKAQQRIAGVEIRVGQLFPGKRV